MLPVFQLPENYTRCIEAFSDLQNRVGPLYITHCNGHSGSCVAFILLNCQDLLKETQYIHLNLPTQIFNPTDLWQNYPHIPLAAPLKLYYLTQTAFYIHQVLILNAEARRKDHIQMITHHVITIFLMATSYFSNFTRVGCLIMVLMDWCDIFLPVRSHHNQVLCSRLMLVSISWPK